MCNIKEFNNKFGDDEACLEFLFKRNFGHLKKCPNCHNKFSYSKRHGTKAYQCNYCANPISPTANTIFHKSSTSLKNWFYVIFLFSKSKNGVAAKEVERQLGVTYKCAWRICNKVRQMFSDDENNDNNSGSGSYDTNYWYCSKRW